MTMTEGKKFRRKALAVLNGMSLTDLEKFVTETRKADVGKFAREVTRDVNGSYTTEAMAVIRGLIPEVLFDRMRHYSATRGKMAA